MKGHEIVVSTDTGLPNKNLRHRAKARLGKKRFGPGLIALD